MVVRMEWLRTRSLYVIVEHVYLERKIRSLNYFWKRNTTCRVFGTYGHQVYADGAMPSTSIYGHQGVSVMLEHLRHRITQAFSNVPLRRLR